MEVADYYLSVHAGICHGQVEITGIYIGEKAAWEGSMTTAQSITINKTDLFGGNKKEGGVSGQLYFAPGEPTSASPSLPDGLAKRLGRTTDTCPAFTGIANVWFTANTGNADSGGFMWGSNTPYLKTLWARVRRRSNTFPAAVGEPSNYSNMGSQANPAHMIYECLTNTDWGMGASTGIIDTASFQAGAKALFNEGFGLSMIWTQQATIESFITEILDHIQATVFLNPQTGLLTLKLIRDDYNPSLLAVLSPDNCKVTKFQRKLWGETINEINVSWTNPATESEETVTQHDLANIEQQGAIVSETRNYYGIRAADLAMKVAVRDIRSAAAPLASFEVQCDRSLWWILPGSTIKLTYPALDIEEVILRVNNVDYGRPGDSTIKLTATEDIFALPQSAYTTPGGSGWSDESLLPAPLEYYEVLTLPAYFASRIALAASIAALEFPEVFLGVLGTTTSRDTRSFELFGEVIGTTGDPEWANLGTKVLTARTTTRKAMPAEVSTTLSMTEAGLDRLSVGNAPVFGGFAVIGEGGDLGMEVALITSVTGDYSSITLSRGVLDSVPRAWPINTPIWFIDTSGRWGEDTIFSAAGTADLKFLSSTSLGTLAVDDAPLVTATLTGRPHLPTRPGNVKVNSTAFGVLYQTGTADFTVTWARRNRLTEDSQIVLWTDGDITPEAGQTTTITVMDMDRNVLTTHNGLTGTSFSLPYASLAGEPAAIVRVTAERDGLESLQGHEIIISDGTGWGTNWGNDYGGS